MTMSELKTALRKLTESYFVGAVVRFANQSFTPKPEKPLVLLTVAPVSRPINPPVKVIDGRPVAFYPASTTIQVDLFTNGAQKEIAPGYTPLAENTAEDDLLAFSSFLNSDYVTQWCHRQDIAVVVPNTVQDTSALVRDTSYEFRATMEITVYFTMTAIGYTATLAPESVKHSAVRPDGLQEEGGDIQADDVTALVPELAQTPSGGGNVEMVVEENDYFTNVEINHQLVKEEK